MCGARPSSKAASRFTGTLAHPPSNTGAFQNIGVRDALAAPAGRARASAVLRRRRGGRLSQPPEMCRWNRCKRKITASAGTPDPAMLDDGDLEKTTKLPIPKAGESNWIQYEFPQPQDHPLLTIVTKGVDFDHRHGGRRSRNPRNLWKPATMGRTSALVAKVPEGGAPEHTLSFAPGDREVFSVSRSKAHASTSIASLGEWLRSRVSRNEDWRTADRL